MDENAAQEKVKIELTKKEIELYSQWLKKAKADRAKLDEKIADLERDIKTRQEFLEENGKR